MTLGDTPPTPPTLAPLHLIWDTGGFWLPVAAIAAVVLLALLAISYWRSGATRGSHILAAALKAIAVILLALCLLEPRFSGSHAKPGANQFVVLADNSQSMTLKDPGGKSRGDQLKTLAGKDAPWLAQLGRDFDLRQFYFDSQLHDAPAGFDALNFDGKSSDLGASIDRLVRRYQGRPLAGIILLTDGSATDAQQLERVVTSRSTGAGTPPLYPVVMGKPSPAPDAGIDHVDVTQTNFEDAPVTISAQVTTTGMKGKTIVAELLDEKGKSVQQNKFRVDDDNQDIVTRFLVKPDEIGISFYTVRVAIDGQLGEFDHPETTTEATLANNTRMVEVDRGRGPFRVLYVSGRPNWEYKFLARAVDEDKQVNLVGLIRIAKREPKFQFIGRAGENANPLFQGFTDQTQPSEDSTEYDKPILERLNTDGDELKDGFPKTAEDLFAYHAIVLQDVESEFFSQDQMQLIREFVRKRGGGLLMLGGEESFKNGDYDKSPIGDLLPVYVDQVQYPPEDLKFGFDLTPEGWLEPFLREHSEQDADLQRIESLKQRFTVVNPVRGIKPGATILARATADGVSIPAFVEQRFGKGRSAAMLIGDLYQWEMHRDDNSNPDFEKNWRQIIRWLVSDVPDRVTLAAEPAADSDEASGALRLSTQVHDAHFSPLDNAAVVMNVTGPDGKSVELHAQESPKEPGLYQAIYVPRLPGAYRAQVNADGPDGHPVGNARAGWATDPAAEEFRELQPNLALMDRVARETGGQVVKAADLPKFAAALPFKKAQITESYVEPFWQKPLVFLLAIACLAAEWGLRRWKGLP